MPAVSMPQCSVNVLFIDPIAASVYDNGGLLAPSTPQAVGIDLRACLGVQINLVLHPGERIMVHTGIAVEPLISGIAGFVYSRSGLGGLSGITVAQGVGVIDPDYRGEITVPLLNTATNPYTITHGERIAQLIFHNYYQPAFSLVTSLGTTERGTGGFGHTGKD